MSHPPMFGTFTVTVDGSSDLCRGPDTLQQRNDSQSAVPSSAEDMVTEFSDNNFHHLPAPSARLAFSPVLDTSESTISPTFSNFSPSTSSGYSIPSPDSEAVNTPSDPDDAWNLIPYNVSWGHEYEEYRAGILPGPEGDCVFLRSPTPLRNQRASEACKKCRERKAKCTGTRPSCARCASRDYICEYASEASSDAAGANTPTTSTSKARRPSRRETRGDQALLAQHHKESPPPTPGKPPGPNHCTVIKAEMPEFLSLHHYTDQSSYWEGSTSSDDCSMEEPWQFHNHEGLLPDSTNHQKTLARQRPSSITVPHPVSGGHQRTTHPGPQPVVVAPASLPTHAGDMQAAAVAASAAALHAQIQLPLLPHFDMPSQRLAEHEVYVQPEVKYEQSTAFGPGPHPYDSTTAIYHQAGQDYTISMQPLQHGFDSTNGLPMHIPAPKLAFNGFATPPYVNYLPGP